MYYVLTKDGVVPCTEKLTADQVRASGEDRVVTDRLSDVIVHCNGIEIDWRGYVPVSELSPVILLTTAPEDQYQALYDKAAAQHGCIAVKFAPFRKDKDYRSVLAFDWLDSVGAKMFLYLEL